MNVIEKIKNGKQVGFDKYIDIDGVKHWLLIAIQLHEGKFISHIAFIKESNMAAESFEIEKTISCGSIECAIDALKRISPVQFEIEEFQSFKGQKGFYPEGELIESYAEVFGTPCLVSAL
jgi:hypothetical protein